MQKRGKRVRVTVTREDLLKEPPGWLSEWTAFAEEQGCLQQGKGLEFATRILDAVPLDPSTAYRLMHSDNVIKGYIDLGTENRLQVVSPVMRQGADSNAPVISTAITAGGPNQLNVDIQTSNALLGVETAWYSFQERPDHNGSRIVAVSAERTIGGRTEPAASPLIDYFQFGPSAAFYRLYYKAELTSKSITEIVIAAPNRAELDRRTQLFIDDPSVCRQSDPEMCVVIPRRVAVNPFMVVMVNGAEVRLNVRSRVREAVRSAGGPRNPEELVPQLILSKPYGDTLKPVIFDRKRPDILDVTLLGGESISWK
jgi:hypothetical protein